MNRLLAAALAILLLALPISAFAEGTDPIASEPPEAARRNGNTDNYAGTHARAYTCCGSAHNRQLEPV